MKPPFFDSVFSSNLSILCSERGSKWPAQRRGRRSRAREGRNLPFALPRSAWPAGLHCLIFTPKHPLFTFFEPGKIIFRPILLWSVFDSSSWVFGLSSCVLTYPVEFFTRPVEFLACPVAFWLVQSRFYFVQLSFWRRFHFPRILCFFPWWNPLILTKFFPQIWPFCALRGPRSKIFGDGAPQFSFFTFLSKKPQK